MPHPDGEISVNLKKTPTGGLSAEIELPPGRSGVLRWKNREKALHGGRQHVEL